MYVLSRVYWRITYHGTNYCCNILISDDVFLLWNRCFIPVDNSIVIKSLIQTRSKLVLNSLLISIFQTYLLVIIPTISGTHGTDITKFFNSFPLALPFNHTSTILILPVYRAPSTLLPHVHHKLTITA